MRLKVIIPRSGISLRRAGWDSRSKGKTMTGNLKVPGLALLAVFALSAVIAAGAQAQVKFTVGSAPSWLTGEVIEHPVIGKRHTFTLSGGQVLTCEEISFTATVENGATTVTVIPTYHKCHI